MRGIRHAEAVSSLLRHHHTSSTVLPAPRDQDLFSQQACQMSRSRRLALQPIYPLVKNVTVWNAKAYCCFQTAKWTIELRTWAHPPLNLGHQVYCRHPFHFKSSDRAVACIVVIDVISSSFSETRHSSGHDIPARGRRRCHLPRFLRRSRKTIRRERLFRTDANHGNEQGDPLCSEIPEWLQEFKGNLVGDENPLQGGSHASSSHEASLEPTTKRRKDLGKHNVHTHFPKYRNCEICKRTKITRAPCRRRNGEAVPRAANFGDLITADHKVLSDNCEFRNNHRYAVVVQDLATQWIQAYPCRNKTSQETQRSLQKFLEPERKPKVIYTDNSLEFGKACEDLSWNHCTSTPH